MKIKNKIRTALCKFLIPDIYKHIEFLRDMKNSDIWDYDFDNYITYGDLAEKERDINYYIGQQIDEAKQEALDKISDVQDNLENDISDLRLEKSQLVTCIFKLAEKLNCEDEIHKIFREDV